VVVASRRSRDMVDRAAPCCDDRVTFLKMMERFIISYHSPIGWLAITGNVEGILAVEFVESVPPTSAVDLPAWLQISVTELDEYFHGQRQAFSVKLILQGTDFQKRVWQQLLTIPYGVTVSYQKIAHAIGNPNAVRAVGSANGSNPIPIMVPCHRVLARDGKLVGYGGGLWRKEWLLRHEGNRLV